MASVSYKAGPGLGTANGVPYAFNHVAPSLTIVLAKVTDRGPLGTEDDYTDYRYFCSLQANFIVAGDDYNTTLDVDDAMNDAGLAIIPNPEKYIVTAYNIDEYTEATHSLPVGAFVKLALLSFDLPNDDTQQRPRLRWIMLGGGNESKGTVQFQSHVMLTDLQDGWSQLLCSSIS